MSNKRTRLIAMALFGGALVLALIVVLFRGDGQADSRRNGDGVTLRDGGRRNRTGSADGGESGVEGPRKIRVRPSEGGAPSRASDDPTSPAMLGPDGQPLATGLLDGTGGPGTSGTLVLGPDGRPMLLAGESPAGGPGGPAGRNTANAANPNGSNPSDEGLRDADGNLITDPDATPTPTADGEGGVFGQVLRSEEPIEGARLRLSSNDANYLNETVSDAEGNYRIAGLPLGTYQLYLIEPTAPNSTRSFVLASADQWVRQDFVVPAAEPATGTVVDAQTSTGIPEASIKINQGSTYLGQVTSGDGGGFTLIPLEAGDYTLIVEAKGYARATENLTIPDGTAPPSLEIRLTRDAVVQVLVLAPGGGPGSGAFVSLFASTGLWNDPYGASGIAVADGGGACVLALPDATVTIPFQAGAWKEGLLPAYSAMQTPGSVAAPVTVNLETGGTIAGRVVDENGEPVPEAKIEVSAGYARTRNIYQRLNIQIPLAQSGEDGVFELKPVEPGEVELTVSAEGYIQDKFPFTVSAGRLDAGDLKIESADVPKPGRIFGVVVDDGMRGIGGASIYMVNKTGPGSAQVYTDSTGGFKADNLPDGQYVIFMSGSMLRGDLWIPLGYTYPFAVPGDERIYLVFDLAHSLKLRVTDSFERAHTSFDVQVSVEDLGSVGAGGEAERIGMNYQMSMQTTDGNVVLGNLIAGIATVTVTVPDVGTSSKGGVLVPASGAGDAGTIVIETGAAIEGRVIAAESGAPLSGVKVEGIPTDIYRKFEATTDASGGFRLGGLPAGRINLTFWKDGRHAYKMNDVATAAKETVNVGDIRLEQGAILVGTVTNHLGSPVNNVVLNVAQSYTLYSDGQGRFRGDFLPEGTQPVVANDGSGLYEVYRGNVDLTKGQETTLNIVLQPRM